MLNHTDFNLSEVFYLTLAFSTSQVNKLVLAKDSKDAIKTIEEFYDEPTIIAIVSIQEILNLLDEVMADPTIVFVMETQITPEGFTRIVHKELNQVISSLEQKYNGKDYVILNQEFLVASLSNALASLNEIESNGLISTSFIL